MGGVTNKIWFQREGLFAKYVMALVGLVVFVLAVNGAIEIWISYRGIKTSLNDGMSEKAQATSKQIASATSSPSTDSGPSPWPGSMSRGMRSNHDDQPPITDRHGMCSPKGTGCVFVYTPLPPSLGPRSGRQSSPRL